MSQCWMCLRVQSISECRFVVTYIVREVLRSVCCQSLFKCIMKYKLHHYVSLLIRMCGAVPATPISYI